MILESYKFYQHIFMENLIMHITAQYDVHTYEYKVPALAKYNLIINMQV